MNARERYGNAFDPMGYVYDSPAAALKKMDKKFTISLDDAFKDNSNAITINTSAC